MSPVTVAASVRYRTYPAPFIGRKIESLSVTFKSPVIVFSQRNVHSRIGERQPKQAASAARLVGRRPLSRFRSGRPRPADAEQGDDLERGLGWVAGGTGVRDRRALDAPAGAKRALQLVVEVHGWVKIGHAASPKLRLDATQSSCPSSCGSRTSRALHQSQSAAGAAG